MALDQKPEPMSDAEADQFIRECEERADVFNRWLAEQEARYAHLPPAERTALIEKMIAEKLADGAA